MEQHETRALNAVIALDVVGYSRHMGRDEETTLRRLRDYRDLIEQIIRRHGGRVFGVAGDSEMAILPDAVGALESALEIQQAVEAQNTDLAQAQRMPLRLGINFGNVRIEGDGVYGDDVNIAARLENFAEAGQICISGAMFDRVLGKVHCDFDDFGPQRFKNIAQPVHVYGLRPNRWASGNVRPARRRRPRPGHAACVAAVVALVATIGAGTWGYHAYSERARIEVEANRRLAAARTSAESAELEVARLMSELRAAEQRVAQERRRVEALLAALRAAQDRALTRDSAADVGLAWERKAEELMAELRKAEAQVRDERARAADLLAALVDAERRAVEAWRNVEPRTSPKEARGARYQGQDRDALFLTTWTALRQEASTESAQTADLLRGLVTATTKTPAAADSVPSELLPPRPRVKPGAPRPKYDAELVAVPDSKPLPRSSTEASDRPPGLAPEPVSDDVPPVSATSEEPSRTLRELADYLDAHRSELQERFRAYQRKTGYPALNCSRANLFIGGLLQVQGMSPVGIAADAALVDVHLGNSIPSCNTVATHRYRIRFTGGAAQVVGHEELADETLWNPKPKFGRERTQYSMTGRRDSVTRAPAAAIAAMQAEVDAYLQDHLIDLSRRFRIYRNRTKFPRVRTARSVQPYLTVTKIHDLQVQDIRDETFVAEVTYQFGRTPDSPYAFDIDRAQIELNWQNDELQIIGHLGDE